MIAVSKPFNQVESCKLRRLHSSYANPNAILCLRRGACSTVAGKKHTDKNLSLDSTAHAMIQRQD